MSNGMTALAVLVGVVGGVAVAYLLLWLESR